MLLILTLLCYTANYKGQGEVPDEDDESDDDDDGDVDGDMIDEDEVSLIFNISIYYTTEMIIYLYTLYYIINN